MLEGIIKSIFGDPSEKKVKQLTKDIAHIKKYEEEQKDFTQADIQEKTKTFQARFEDFDITKETDLTSIKNILDEIKYEAFALVKTAAKLMMGQTFELKNGETLTWNMIPYDVQLVGGLAIHEGSVAEMKTGEGKTLVATLPAYLNALTGYPVHIVTVNDYLAQRDYAEMGALYEFMGLTTGVVYSNQPMHLKKEAYEADIVYATNNELGFDYLRDNMVIEKKNKVQGTLFFAVIDEVDSILIDEARTPLIISAPDNEPTSKYMKFAAIAKNLQENAHYKIDEKQKAATLTEDGIKKIEELLRVENIYVSAHYNDIHHIENALKAMAAYKKDKDYLVIEGEVQIIDEHTGRVLAGRRYSEGLHQAIEAKEGVEIKQESKTLASITFQNYFRMYYKLSGMTGTAKTEEEEFYKVYGLETFVIPTNKPIVRDDRKDLLFKNEKGKFEYVVNLIKEVSQTEQPILVGTVSVEKSEYLSHELTKVGITHNVLNAKNHAHEAEIVASAGQKGAITIATNMAGRGTDIKLGEGVKELGGLYIIGTEKHETRRIDNQLRGRAGRQGDDGITQFLISPNDDIMRIFGGDKLFGIFNSAAFSVLPDNEPLMENGSGMLTRRVVSVQKQVEGHHFDMRKHILEYDDVINKHRQVIYMRRDKILNSENIHEDVLDMLKNQIFALVESEVAKLKKGRESADFDAADLIKKVNAFVGIEAIDTKTEFDDVENIKDANTLADYIYKIALEELDKLKADAVSEEAFFDLERRIVLSSMDDLWMRHIDSMSKLKDTVAFEGYAQKNPLTVYKEKAFFKFDELINEIGYRVVKGMFSVRKAQEVEEVNYSEKDMQANNISVDDLITITKEDDTPTKKQQKQSSVNPLFNTGEGVRIKTLNGNSEKKKIRV